MTHSGSFSNALLCPNYKIALCLHHVRFRLSVPSDPSPLKKLQNCRFTPPLASPLPWLQGKPHRLSCYSFPFQFTSLSSLFFKGPPISVTMTVNKPKHSWVDQRFYKYFCTSSIFMEGKSSKERSVVFIHSLTHSFIHILLVRCYTGFTGDPETNPALRKLAGWQ